MLHFTITDGMEGCVLTSGSISGQSVSPQLAAHGAPPAQHLLLKRKRGRPPKNYYIRPGEPPTPSRRDDAESDRSDSESCGIKREMDEVIDVDVYLLSWITYVRCT